MMKYYNGRQILEEIENSTSHRGILLSNVFVLNRKSVVSTKKTMGSCLASIESNLPQVVFERQHDLRQCCNILVFNSQ